MKYVLVIILVSGCAEVISQTGICDELGDDIDRLTSALVTDGGPKSQEAGVAVISGFDGACG